MSVSAIPLRDAAFIHTDSLKKLRNLALGTLRNYRGSYHTLAAHLEPQLGREPLTSDLTYEALEDFFAEYVAAQAPKSWEMKRSNYIAIVKWLMRKGYLEAGINFAEDIPLRKPDPQSPRDRRLSDKEFFRLLEAAKRSHWRDYFLCLFLRLTGRRISEVVGSINGDTALRWGDVEWDDDCILWDNLKARRYGRKMPLTPRVRAVLEAWKAIYAAEFGLDELPHDWYIFPALTATGIARKGRARPRVLSPRNMMTNANRVIRPLMEAAGLYKHGDGWHVLRKTFANQRKQFASNTGRADAWELTKIALDHTSESTTRIYVSEDEDYQRFATWAMSAPEMSADAMAAIPELAAFAVTPETTKEPATTSEPDAPEGTPVYTGSNNLATVIPLTSRHRQRALG